jgi:hypothetical protein
MGTQEESSGRLVVTVTCKCKPHADAILGARYTLSFSRLPDQTFGPYSFMDARGQLIVSALLSAPDARNLILDAYANGTAEMNGG